MLDPYTMPIFACYFQNYRKGVCISFLYHMITNLVMAYDGYISQEFNTM